MGAERSQLNLRDHFSKKKSATLTFLAINLRAPSPTRRRVERSSTLRSTNIYIYIFVPHPQFYILCT